MNEIEIDKEELISATAKIMDFCQEQGMDELLAYMAMINITKTMEEISGFRYKRKPQS